MTAGQWDEARALLSLLSTRLRVDFLTIKPPGLGQFAEVEVKLVPLFVLEVLVVTRQRHELQLRLAAWDCLAGLQSRLGCEKRDKLLLAALERLAEGEAGPNTISVMVRASEVLGPAMREEQQPATRRRHEIMANILFQLMLNDSQTSGKTNNSQLSICMPDLLYWRGSVEPVPGQQGSQAQTGPVGDAGAGVQPGEVEADTAGHQGVPVRRAVGLLQPPGQHPPSQYPPHVRSYHGGDLRHRHRFPRPTQHQRQHE